MPSSFRIAGGADNVFDVCVPNQRAHTSENDACPTRVRQKAPTVDHGLDTTASAGGGHAAAVPSTSENEGELCRCPKSR
jgi:hypothetical protein